jgi:cytochrome b
MNGDVRTQLVWDWPIRVFHWLLVLSVISLFVTGKLGGNWLEWHRRAGYLVLGLVMFRVIWGFVGEYHARFANFVRGPKKVVAYLRGSVQVGAEGAGHNPLGALSVLAMLAVIGFQAGTGLFANDDVMLEGPYAVMIGKDLSDWLTKLHKINSYVILGLVALHVLAIAYYFFRKHINLVSPMITGNKILSVAIPQRARPAWLAPCVIALVAAAVYVLVYRLPH